MRILQLLTREHNRSGSGIQMMQLALELDRRGHDLTCIYGFHPDHGADFLPYQDSGVNLRRISLETEKLKLYNLSDVGKIRAMIKGQGFDLIHTHSNAVDHAVLATIGLDIPIVANRGMSSPLKWKNSLKYRTGKVAHIIAVSENVKQVMCKTGNISPDKISVVYGSVDTHRFRPDLDTPITRKALGIAEDARIVGYTGSIGGRKGIDYLVEAFARVRQDRPNAVLLLVGIADDDMIRRNVRIDDSLRPFVKCVGFQHHPELYMPLYDVFVFPGTKSEGLTGAIREAASMAIPVVTTDVGGNRELIENGNCGIVVEPKNSPAMADAITRILDQPAWGRESGLNGRQYIQQAMSIAHRTDQVEKIYRSVVLRQPVQQANLQEMTP